MELVSIYNDKGGVGKTSTLLEIGVALATAGKRVLLIDNDPQGTLSGFCVKDMETVEHGMDSIYKGKCDVIDAITDTFMENLFIVPCGRDLKSEYFRTDERLHKTVDNCVAIFKKLESFIGLFDVVLLDNPPVQDGSSLYFTFQADRIVIPVIPDEACFDGLIRTYQILENQCSDFESKKIVVVPTLVKNRGLHKKYLAAIVKAFQGRNGNTSVSEMVVTDRAEVPESISMKQNLFISHAASESSMQYKKLCLDIFNWLDRDQFLKALENAAEQKKRAAQERFKTMIQERKTATLKERGLVNA
jgi:chromosome partitioning protein